MKTAIEIAWDENLELGEYAPYEDKEEIIVDRCPVNNSFNCLNLKEPKYCPSAYNEQACTKCWNRKVEDTNKIPNIVHKEIIKADNDKLEELFDEFLREVNGKQNIDGAYMFLQFLLKHK